jgi:hypothetical protein
VELFEKFGELERRLFLAQTEIKGHMRVEDELKAKLAQYRVELKNSSVVIDSLKALLEESGEVLKTCEARLAELEKDAARYAWLRDTHSEWGRLFAEPIKWEGGAWVKLGSRWVKGHLDAAIDAAIKDRA